jgi:photosystem II cytochrome c550
MKDLIKIVKEFKKITDEMRRPFLSVIVLFAFSSSAWASDLDDAVRTVQLSSTKTVTLTPEQVKRGKRLFNNSCSVCHTGGITKTNPNVGLDTEALSLAIPTRNNIEGLVDYMKNPTTFDGAESIAEIHPSIKSADIFPKMRSLTEDDLYAIAGHILIQPKIVAEKWGGGKIYY